MSILESAALSDVGCVRITNQDRMFAKTGYINGNHCGLFAVADGMGGLSEGEHAAIKAVDALEQWWNTKLHLLVGYTAFNENDITHELVNLFHTINNDIGIYSRTINAMIGTTFSVLLICNNDYYIVHAGDSRIYMVTWHGLSKQIQKLTNDHTWLAKQLQEGAISTDDIDEHSRGNKLTSCLGVLEEPEIFVSSGAVETNSLFILCSDGLHNIVDEGEVLKKATRRTTCTKLVKKLIDMAIKREAADNITVVAVKCKK